MTRTGVALAALVAATAATAQTRRTDPDPGVPLVSRLPAHLADPALVDELKLTPDQVKALAPAGPGTGGMKTSGTPKVGPGAGGRAKDVLTPEQYERAVQLMAQDALRTGRGRVVTPAALVAVPAATFRRHPELADAARLTREQRRRVALAAAAPAGPVPGPGGRSSDPGGLPATPHVVLDPEQTAALAAFVGPLRTTPFPAPAGGPPAGATVTRPAPTSGPGGFVPPSQRVMLALNNRGELKLTEEQVTTLTALLNAGRTVFRPAGEGPTPPPPPPPANTGAALAKALTPAQLTRLGQIELWQLVPRGSDDTARLGVPRVAAELELTTDQTAGLKTIGQTHRERAARAVETADTAADLKAALAAARAEVAAAVGGLLTESQAAKLRDLFGPEYRGAGAGGVANDVVRRIRAAGFGQYQFELLVVNRFPNVAEDLKLTEDQKAALSTAEAAFNQQFRQAGLNYDGPEQELARQLGEQSKAMQKIFTDHLTADQRKRLRELGIQLRQQLGANQAGGGTYPITGAPGVAEELKLTDEQRKRIIDTGEEDEVLSAAQRTALTRLAGTPLAGGFNLGGPARGRPARPSPRLALLHAGTAHAELGLSPAQARLIAESIEEHAAELRPAGSARSAGPPGYAEPPPAEAVEDAVRACEKACDSVLTTAQRDRLGQLTLQASAAVSLTAAFARPEVAEKLAFTPDQRAALDALAADYRDRVTLVTGLPDTAGWAELRRRAPEGMRERARQRMMGVLTARQAAAWQDLTGAPCPAVAAGAPPGDPGRDP